MPMVNPVAVGRIQRPITFSTGFSATPGEHSHGHQPP